MKNSLSKAVTHLAYPVLLAATLAVMAGAAEYSWDLKRTLGLYLSGLLLVLIVLERLFPLSPRWGMTRDSFLRDLKYLAASGAAIAAVRWSFGALAIGLGARQAGQGGLTGPIGPIGPISPLAGIPWWAGTAAFLLVFELLQYGWHRWSHSHPFLWRIHLAHHLPDRVYVVMHPVFHPLNALVNAALIQAVMLLLGLPPQAVFAAFLLLDLQTMVSHFNVDIRAGYLNYLFVGTELHRYHHSADVAEARNFGTVVPFWDMVFGTFLYRPGRVPAALGAGDGAYPRSAEFWKVMALPFK